MQNHLGISSEIQFGIRKMQKKKRQFLTVFLGGPMGPIQPLWPIDDGKAEGVLCHGPAAEERYCIVLGVHALAVGSDFM